MRASKWLAITVALILPAALTTGVFNGLSLLGIILTVAAVCAEFSYQLRTAPYGDEGPSRLDRLDGVGGPEWVPALTVWEESK